MYFSEAGENSREWLLKNAVQPPATGTTIARSGCQFRSATSAHACSRGRRWRRTVVIREGGSSFPHFTRQSTTASAGALTNSPPWWLFGRRLMPLRLRARAQPFARVYVAYIVRVSFPSGPVSNHSKVYWSGETNLDTLRTFRCRLVSGSSYSPVNVKTLPSGSHVPSKTSRPVLIESTQALKYFFFWLS